MSLAIYTPTKQHLPATDFVRDTFNQLRIDKGNVSSVKVEVIKCLSENATHLGIKEINPDLISDCFEMILMRYKELSVDELHYAFKLHRFGELEKVEHYQLLNADFVQKVLSNYKAWKSAKIKKENISQRITRKELTEEEKEIQIVLGIIRSFDEYLKGIFTGVGFHYYDYLTDKGLIDVSREDKLKALDQAKLSLVGQARDKRERGELHDLKTELQRINTKLDLDVIQRAKSQTLLIQFERWKQQNKQPQNLLNNAKTAKK